MEYPSPVKEGFTVYTRLDCKYCVKVKDLLRVEDEEVIFIPADDFLVNKDAFLAFIESKGAVNHKTFPMVFHNGSFIGGFSETLKFMAPEKQN